MIVYILTHIMHLTVDKNGCLTRKELCQGLLNEGYEHDDISRRLPLLVSSLDNDGNGEITKD